MKRKDINKCITIDKEIKHAERVILRLEKLKEDEELKINSPYSYNGHEIVTGKEKEDIINILINKQKNIIDKKMKELKNL